MTERPFDLLIVGGGVNGAGVARDAAGRGLRVALVEQGDLASATSSASSKLIHGGLRYLEQYEFRLVREALGEREVLLGVAPHIIRPMTFVLPHDRTLRPAWMIRAGLFLYDHLARRATLPGSRRIDLRRHAAGAPLAPAYTTGFTYSDCWVDDARLVVLNAMDARERGADIRVRTRFLEATPQGDHWRARVIGPDGAIKDIAARVLVNAAGPWVEQVLRDGIGATSVARIRMVKGSHIVVPRLYDGDRAYILQNPDKRIVFVIPYEGEFSLIGTTDVEYEGDPRAVAISDDERAYLCESVSRFFAKPVAVDAIVWTYAGVRPLHDDDAGANASTVTRDYVFDLQAGGGRPPVLSIYGGKITTYRRLAEHALDKLAEHVEGRNAGWTRSAPLPGGDLPRADFRAFLREAGRRFDFLPQPLLLRMAHAYGTRIARVLDGARQLSDLGADLGAGLTEREVDYLVAQEFAVDAADILWRRTKLGLHGGPALAAALEEQLSRKRAMGATVLTNAPGA